MRNICAHNSRTYNCTIHTTPEILDVDKVVPSPAHNGLYQILLAMKYLRSSDEEWTVFVNAFDKLIQNNKADPTKHFLLKSVRLSAECYDKHFAIF